MIKYPNEKQHRGRKAFFQLAVQACSSSRRGGQGHPDLRRRLGTLHPSQKQSVTPQAGLLCSSHPGQGAARGMPSPRLGLVFPLQLSSLRQSLTGMPAVQPDPDNPSPKLYPGDSRPCQADIRNYPSRDGSPLRRKRGLQWHRGLPANKR